MSKIDVFQTARIVFTNTICDTNLKEKKCSHKLQESLKFVLLWNQVSSTLALFVVAICVLDASSLILSSIITPWIPTWIGLRVSTSRQLVVWSFGIWIPHWIVLCISIRSPLLIPPTPTPTPTICIRIPHRIALCISAGLWSSILSLCVH